MDAISDLIRGYHPAATDYETDDAAVYVVAVFDHDHYGQHLLVRECRRGEPGVVWALWYRADDRLLIRVRDWTQVRHKPLLAAAALVGCWEQHGHWSGVAVP